MSKPMRPTKSAKQSRSRSRASMAASRTGTPPGKRLPQGRTVKKATTVTKPIMGGAPSKRTTRTSRTTRTTGTSLGRKRY